jgi:hypothetical protein
VGGLDDPIWRQLPPLGVRRDARQVQRSRRRALIVIASLGLWIAGSLWLAWPGQHPGGDPGGRILDQLRPVTSSVPPKAKITYKAFSEPTWQNCAGQPEQTEGWNNASLDVSFSWSGSSSALISYVNTQLSKAGWGAFTSDGSIRIAGDWTKKLRNGTEARVLLQFWGLLPSEQPAYWALDAAAPPVGPTTAPC